MRDWTAYVRERLSLPGLQGPAAREVVEEVASQLEDVYEAARARGSSEAEAEAEACSHVRDWEELAAAVRRTSRTRREGAGRRAVERADAGLRRGGRGARWLADLMLDVRYAFRTLRKSPGFTATVVLLVALGVGANTAVFSVLKAVVLQPLPYPQPNELMVLWSTTTRGGRGPASWPDYLDWKAQNRSFEQMGLSQGLRLSLTDGDVPEQVRGAMVTSSVFDVFGVNAALGRTILPEEDASDARVVVLSHELWATRYESDPSILGRTIRLSDEPYKVVGVMPRSFAMTSPWNANDPYLLWTSIPASILTRPRDSYSYPVYGRLKDGATLAAARKDMDRVGLGLAEAYPATNRTQRALVQPLHVVLYGAAGGRLLLVLGAAALVLLIACGNVAGLLLARSATRRREIAVRAALGAGRMRMLRQLLTESGLLALAGGVVAVILVFWGLGALRSNLPSTLPRVHDIALDGPVLGTALLVSLITGLLFGLVPAVQAARISHVEALKEVAGRGGRAHGRVRSAFVVAQLALTLTLVHGTVLLVGSYLLLRRHDTGFNPKNVLTMSVSLSGPRYADEQTRLAFFKELVPRLDALPGVREAAVVNRLPFEGGTNARIIVEGREIPPDPNDRPLVERKAVLGDYLHVMGIPLRAGRMIDERDAAGVPGVVINERMAERIWPGVDPLGKRFSYDDNPPHWLTVVGVAGNVSQWGAEWGSIPEAFRPYALFPRPVMYLALKTDVPPATLVRAVRREVLAVDPDMPVTEIRTGEQLMGEQFSQRELMTTLIGLFAVLALVLAVAGIYGVIAYHVAQRTQELGVRIALGASRGRLLRLVLGRGLALAAVGVVLGTGGAVAASRITRNALYGLSPTNAWSIAGAALLLLAVAAVATLVPARRATTVDPARALQAE
jgi:putative ABC transport system permease protein